MPTVRLGSLVLEDTLHHFRQWAAAYPEEVFPGPTDAEIVAVTEAFPGLVDRLSAAMGRHIAGRLGELADDLERAAAVGSAR
jgi:hypothetical protein